MARPGEDVAALERERQTTRFVVLNNLVVLLSLLPGTEGGALSSASSNAAIWEENPRAIAHAIRAVVEPFQTSSSSGDSTTDAGVEVFVPSQTSKRTRYCHVGMRSAEDARAVVLGLQGKIVEWPWLGSTAAPQSNPQKEPCHQPRTLQSGILFVDYAAITQRSEARAIIRGSGGLEEKEKRETTRPQCTSTTDHVQIPGLVLIPDFVSAEEETLLMAILTGPQAPWAPSQKTASYETAPLRRKVQHYGYVFDYRTADVLRDRTQQGANCPPIPALPDNVKENLSSGDDQIDNGSSRDFLAEHIQACINDGNGWESLAGLTERTRRQQFEWCGEGNSSSLVLGSFPHLNQLTVNHYLSGEGIGSHIDTPSAFDDGLISISLNSGIVMEFRKADDKTIKKLLYLPPRSLLLMSRDARYKWEHAIVTRMTDTHNGKVLPRQLRLSLTFRTARSSDGASPMPLVESAEYPPVWGDQRSKLKVVATPDCERDHVHAVYDAIATQWHHTRGKRGVLWPGATEFLQKLPQGSIVADVGCGDGKVSSVVP